MNEKRLNRFEALYPIFDGLSMDLLFWVAIDTLFLTYVKHFTASQIVSLTTTSLVSCIILYFPMLWCIRRIGNTVSVRLGTGLLLCSAALLTVGTSFYAMAAGRILYEIGMTFRSIVQVSLRKNLDLRGRGDRYIVIRSRANTIYAAVTMLISFVAGPMFNLNPYFPMLGCLFFCAVCFVLSFFMIQEKGTVQEEKKSRQQVQWSSVTLIAAASFSIFFPIVTCGQVDGKLFIQNDLSEFFGDAGQARVVTLITAMVAVSRIIRTASNLLFAPIYRKYGDRVGLWLSILLLSAIGLEVAGHLLSAGIYVRFLIMGVGYNFILFLRDPFKVYIQDVYLKHLRQEDMETAIMLMELMRKVFHAILSFSFAALLTKYELITEMEILIVLAVFEVLLSAVLLGKLKKSRRVA